MRRCIPDLNMELFANSVQKDRDDAQHYAQTEKIDEVGKSSQKTKRRGRPRQSTSLATMALDALISLRDDAEQLIGTRASAQRKALEKQFARINIYVGGGRRRKARKGRSLKGRKVAPKYRNPANRSETWAGRGARPRWLQAQLKSGRKIEEFAITR